MNRRLALAVVACQLLLAPAALADSYNGLALKPPMGFSTWNPYGCPWITEDLIEETATAMKQNGMAGAGYQYVNLDDCWQAGRSLSGPAKTHASRVNGHLVADPQWFPSGMKALGDYIHALGLKFGLYSSHGTATCQNVAGTFGYEDVDARDYADWGIDYFKQDTCNGGLPGDPKAFYTRYKIFSDALKATARDIVFSLCDFTMAGQTWLWGAQIGNLWRTTGDISASYASMVNNFTSNQTRRTYAGPGHWNDPDMLEIGNAGHDPATGGYSTLAAPANAGDTTVQVTSNATSSVNGSPFRIGTRKGGDLESFIMSNRGTAAGAPTPLFAAAKPGDTSIKVASTAGMTVGNKLLVDTIGTTGYNFPVGAGPLPDGTFEGPTITSVGTPGTQTALAARASAGDTNVKVGSVSNVEPGDRLTIDDEIATVDAVGTGAGAATTTALPAAAGDTRVRVSSVAGFTVGEQVGVDDERATVTSVGTAAAAATQLVAPAEPGDTNVKVASVTGLVPGDDIAIDDGGSLETRTIAGVGTAAGAATTTVAPVFAGDTNVKVSSVNGFTVGQQLAIHEPGKLDLGERTEAVTVSAIGTAAGGATTTAAPAAAGDTKVYVGSVNGFVAGQKLQIMEASGKRFETVTVDSVGTAAGGSTTLAAAASAGDTNLKVTSVNGFVAGQQLTVGVGSVEELATVTAVGIAGAGGTGVTIATPLKYDHLILMLVRGIGTGVTLASPLQLAHASGSTTRGQGTGITVTQFVRDHPLATTTNGSGQSGAPGGGVSIRGTGTGVTLTAPLAKSHAGAGTSARGLGSGIGVTALTRAHDSGAPARGLGTGVTLTAPLAGAHAGAALVRDQSKPGTGITFDPPLTAPHAMGAIVRGGGTGITLATPVTHAHPLGSSTGSSSFTVPEAKTHFSLWAMAAAPLIVGADIPNMAQQNLDVILNKDVIAVDQDSLGVQAFTVANVANQWTLMRPLANGDRAVAFFNNAGGDWALASGSFEALGLDPAKAYLAKDLWTKETTKVTDPLTRAFIPSHATVMLRMSDRSPTVTVPGHVTAKSPGDAGVAVSYDARGVDAFGDPLALSCSKPSGSLFPIGPTTVTCSATDLAGRTSSASFVVDVAPPERPLTVGGTVPATLSLTLGPPASFGAFTAGVARDYSAQTTASVTSTAGDAALSVSTARLANGAFTLASPVMVAPEKSTWTGPVSNDAFAIRFTQPIGANEALRTGSYSATLTFTLSTTAP